MDSLFVHAVTMLCFPSGLYLKFYLAFHMFEAAVLKSRGDKATGKTQPLEIAKSVCSSSHLKQELNDMLGFRKQQYSI